MYRRINNTLNQTLKIICIFFYTRAPTLFIYCKVITLCTLLSYHIDFEIYKFMYRYYIHRYDNNKTIGKQSRYRNRHDKNMI